MRSLIKSSNSIFNTQVEELTRVLYGYRHFNSGIQKCFEKLGYEINTSGNHVKCYYDNKLVTTIAKTPSDLNAGHQVLRYIRSFWELNETN